MNKLRVDQKMVEFVLHVEKLAKAEMCQGFLSILFW